MKNKIIKSLAIIITITLIISLLPITPTYATDSEFDNIAGGVLERIN